MINANIKKYSWITIIHGFILFEARHFSSALNTTYVTYSASDFNLNFYSTATLITVLKAETF